MARFYVRAFLLQGARVPACFSALGSMHVKPAMKPNSPWKRLRRAGIVVFMLIALAMVAVRIAAGSPGAPAWLQVLTGILIGVAMLALGAVLLGDAVMGPNQRVQPSEVARSMNLVMGAVALLVGLVILAQIAASLIFK